MQTAQPIPPPRQTTVDKYYSALVDAARRARPDRSIDWKAFTSYHRVTGGFRARCVEAGLIDKVGQWVGSQPTTEMALDIATRVGVTARQGKEIPAKDQPAPTGETNVFPFQPDLLGIQGTNRRLDDIADMLKQQNELLTRLVLQTEKAAPIDL